ncbi:two-component regulator propeller domain-containing protein [Flavobacterium sp. 7A]|uniref:hybrid sensor histidine kinase/response regulator transcription factor n=1 Tax=Flavobacterium sp. 7A TaxID=2940571 RepID=UPI002225E3B3|nr:two-component regulator propeller domain-containing protein [Flavobacterium sp. 7A]MCW2120943.1 signal transduction histidine kinase/ligand-binding sensor domain-containing protein/DNA-binding response OmpR family regulator [Flavobacterium sp. 7A]
MPQLTDQLRLKSYLSIAIIVLLILNTATIYSQKKNAFIHLTTENGLSQSDVNTVFQDSHGFMWFGTHDGLNKYDGYNFTVYNPILNNDKSISSNLIWDIVDDVKGNLWIGTTGGGLNCFDTKTETFTQFKNKIGDFNSISSNTISTLLRDKKNRLWIATKNGVNMLDLNKPISSPIFNHISINMSKMGSSFEGNIISCFLEDNKGNIFIGGPAGLFKLNHDNQGELFFQYIDLGGQLANLGIRAMAQDDYGKFIFAGINGLYIQTNSDNLNKFDKIHDGYFSNLLTTKGYIWAGSPLGLYRFENSSEFTLPKEINFYTNDLKNPDFSLSKNDIKSLFVDKAGMLWVGVNGGGVNKFDPNIKKFKHIKKDLNPNSITNDKIRAIFEDSNGYLWIGTEGGGLNYSVKADAEYTNFKKINSPTAKVFALAEVQEGKTKKLLIGGEFLYGLYSLDITNPNSISPNLAKPVDGINLSVFSILVDSNKNVWIGTYGKGISRWLATKTPGVYTKDILYENANDPNSISSNIIRSIYEDKKGNIWFGTGDGLCELDKSQVRLKKPRFTIYKNIPNTPSSLSQNYILSLYQSQKGDLWVGTFGGGLNKLIPSDGNSPVHFKNYTEEEGLPSNVIKGIQEDEFSNLWISTNKGLSRFNPKSERFKNYDVNDGLQSNEFSELSFYKRKNGEMLFGGVNGFNAFFPNQIKDNLIPSRTVLTSLSIFNKPIGTGDIFDGRVILPESISTIKEIELKYSENSFSIEFAALHYSAPRKNQFAYKLEGFNDDWVYTSFKNRLATYTNLSPGTYNLLVKSSNNDGVWNQSPTELTIIITPPFWRTNFAYFIYLLGIIGLLYLYRRFTIISSTQKHQLELEHLEKENHEEIHRLKLEFFTNISHEFRTPLTLIKGPLDYLISKGETIGQKEVNDQYGLMHKNTNYLLRLVNQLLDFRKMEYGKMNLNLSKSDIVTFLKEVGEPFQFLSHKKQISFEINASKDHILSWFDPDAVEKITNNLLSNAFKFTPENGIIKLDIFDGIDFIKPDFIEFTLDQANFIVIQLKDSGPGVPAHRIQHIFERYYTEIDINNKKNTKGTGIGLSFTKNLVELHQGFIHVKSDSENGTTFYVWLPKNKEVFHENESLNFHEVFEANDFISQEDAESHAISVMDDIADQNISRSRSKLPVLLIVDDNADIRSFIKKGLGEKYYIYEAENGKIGLEMAKKHMPNIVITDLMMPIMDGIELCNQLKSTQETSHIPVIVLTAKTSQEKEIEGLKNGADAYIRKPFNLELLELKISNILKHREELRKRFNRDITLQPNEVTITSSDENFLKQAIDIVEKHMMDTEFSVEMLVKEMNISRSNLYLKIKELTGLSSSEFIRNIRLKRAVQLFEKSDYSVKEIMYMTGFNTASYFSKCFKKQFGVIPSKYIRLSDSELNKEDNE